MQTTQNTTDQMSQFTNTLLQACNDSNTMVRDSMDAMLQSVTVVTKGYSDMMDIMNSLVQKTVQHSTKLSQTMATAKSMTEIMDAQSDLVKTGLDNIITEATNLSQVSARIAQQASEPVTNNLNNTINKMSKSTQAA